jgi:hypothetical protein
MMSRWWFLGALALAACGGGDDDGGGGGSGGEVTADAVLDGEEIAFAQPCQMPQREDDWNVYASGGDPHLGFDLIWGKEVVDGPGTYEVDTFAGITFYVEVSDPAEPGPTDIPSADGSVTFETYAPEDGVVSGSFDVTVDDPPFSATGVFDCM